MKLEIISGSGEFPTGSSILFQDGSDIAIRDGKAAIELRSYYAGKTVIRATSPGLKPNEITITSTGGPESSSETIQEISRPYVRYSAQSNTKGEGTINLLAERPTKVSSSTEGHSPRLANDGDLSTYWEANEKSGETAWWQVDMGNIYSLSQVKLSSREGTAVQYTVEISIDGNEWKTIVEQTSTTATERTRIDEPSAGNAGRFLRIKFKGRKANIAEIQAFGIHIDR